MGRNKKAASPSGKDEGSIPLARKNEEPNPDDPMRATADSLVRIATKAFMRMHDVDYETAQQWIADAVLDEGKNKKSARRPRKSAD